MIETLLTKVARRSTNQVMKRVGSVMVLGAFAASSGCVTVTAPDKPIVINLNINVTQEVVYRLDGQAKSLIQTNPGIF